MRSNSKRHNRSRSAPLSIPPSPPLEDTAALRVRAHNAVGYLTPEQAPTTGGAVKGKKTQWEAITSMDLLLSEQPRKSDTSSKIHSIDISTHGAPPASIEPYSLFSPGRKRLIVILASISAFFAPFSTNSYFPAMTKIEKDFGISTQQVYAFLLLIPTRVHGPD